MQIRNFGFHCGEFSLALSGNGIVLPGSKDQPLKKSSLPMSSMNEAAGPHTLRVTCEGSLICDIPVHVLWVGHSSQPEPFLGIRSEDPEELRRALGAYIGKAVELEFVRR